MPDADITLQDLLEAKLDIGFKSTKDSIERLTTQVTKTNGRVTDLEADKIRHDTEVKYLKLVFLIFVAPVIVAVLTRASMYLLDVIL